jgi:hypothetical protein
MLMQVTPVVVTQIFNVNTPRVGHSIHSPVVVDKHLAALRELGVLLPV